MDTRLKIVAAAGLGWVLLAAGAGWAQSPTAGPTLPAGVTAAQVAAGEALFNTGTCRACHGAGGKSGSLGPDLTTGAWMWSDGDLPGLTQTIAKGVPEPKQYNSPMPPMGGLQLSPQDLANISAYVWSLGHK